MIHVNIVSGVVNFRLLPLSEKWIVAEEQWFGKAGVLVNFAVCQAINVSSTFSHDCKHATQKVFPSYLYDCAWKKEGSRLDVVQRKLPAQHLTTTKAG